MGNILSMNCRVHRQFDHPPGEQTPGMRNAQVTSNLKEEGRKLLTRGDPQLRHPDRAEC